MSLSCPYMHSRPIETYTSQLELRELSRKSRGRDCLKGGTR